VSIVAGIGYRPEEYSMLDKDWHGRGKLMDECLEVLLRCWREDEPFEWRGRRVHVRPKPLTQPHPVVTVGGMGRNAARRAARFRLPFQPAVNTPEVLAFYLAECERVGFEEGVVIPPGSGQMIYVSEDPDRSWAEIGRYLLYDAMTYASWQPANHRSAVHSDATTVEALRAEGKYLILTPDECVAYAKGQGEVAAISLFPLCGGTPPELAWPGLELYASKVLPRLQG
jgi:alkanesulfonate monooxygenase SsuD/methylene tetrahydromethanopterin reductase-like flavin-dependent oxidoreductase (luciferase family)